MTYQQIIDEYLTLLWRFFQFDMRVFSNEWLYIPLLIPAFCYLIFFLVKWSVLTAPLWMPFTIIIDRITDRIKNK